MLFARPQLFKGFIDMGATAEYPATLYHHCFRWSAFFEERSITQYHHCFLYIEDNTRWRKDMYFIFEWQNNILRTSAAGE